MWKIMVADHKNQAPHRNEVSQNTLLENCICFIFRQMTFLRQKLAENRRSTSASRLIARTCLTLQRRPSSTRSNPHLFIQKKSG